jgi:hypothetical protein
MRSIITASVFIIVLLLVSSRNEANAQARFVDHSTVDGVTIQYRWANSKGRDKNSPLELRLKIKNNNSYPVRVSYEIEFFMGPVLEESSDQTVLCINPKLARTGRINGMYYRSSKLSNEQIESEDFLWEINDLTIEEVESCR